MVMLCGKGLAEEGMGFSISFDDSSGFLAIDSPGCGFEPLDPIVYGNVMIILTIDNDHYVLSKYDLI